MRWLETRIKAHPWWAMAVIIVAMFVYHSMVISQIRSATATRPAPAGLTLPTGLTDILTADVTRLAGLTGQGEAMGRRIREKY